MITVEELRNTLKYDPDTGHFTWIASKRGVAAGARAGVSGHFGSRQITLNRQQYQEHRLAWLYVHGRWPTEHIDHINCNPADNRIANLREATSFQNQGNSRLSKNNTSGFKGVYRNKRTGKWEAKIKFQGKFRHLGTYETAELASEAYWRAAKEQFGEFARLK